MSTSQEAATVVLDIGAAGKAPATTSVAAPAPAPAAPASSQPRKSPGTFFFRRKDHGSRCVALLDFLLRIAAFGPTLAAAIATGTSDETLSVFTQFFQFRARFDDFPAFLFFMVANAITAGYLVLSLPFSAAVVLRPQTTGLRLLLLVCDLIMVALLAAAASAAAAMVDLAHNGNLRANWVAICMQFHGFCQRTSGSVVGSFISVLILMLLVIFGAFAIRKR
ncbi:hypothetical protein GUJ93_ZPchr0004g39182 [Zizania palustris]|uniref:CASP-like protein n=1 Tax=Zizania palustris TaxID=103762 RepID=A0A8J5STH3_ZIZPA|nr:hypothetical protein GUJ93_ZPchr0004g39182 [Zizania palustris]